MAYTVAEIAKWIDHALLNPTLTIPQLNEGIQTAIHHQVAAVCILPFYLKRCAEMLQKTARAHEVKACTTIAFPHGSQSTSQKLAEAKQALQDGAQELDFVVNINQVLSGQWNEVRSEIRALIELVHEQGQKVKVIFENCYLSDGDKIRLCEVCGELNADWIKTSTGFGPGGATVEDVILMRKHSPESVQIKAAGGIKTLDALLAFRAAGATRIGCSRTKEILMSVRQTE